jgi:hypothetical protein
LQIVSGFCEFLLEMILGFGEVFGQVDAEDFVWGLMDADAEALDFQRGPS